MVGKLEEPLPVQGGEEEEEEEEAAPSSVCINQNFRLLWSAGADLSRVRAPAL